jgi:hypothetical protein
MTDEIIHRQSGEINHYVLNKPKKYDDCYNDIYIEDYVVEKAKKDYANLFDGDKIMSMVTLGTGGKVKVINLANESYFTIKTRSFKNIRSKIIYPKPRTNNK